MSNDARIIIDHDASITPLQAIEAVRTVIELGKISECSTGAHYCWCTRRSDGFIIYVRKRKKGQTSDSFLVHRDPKEFTL